MKRRSQPKSQRRSKSYAAKVARGTHPIISHLQFPKYGDTNYVGPGSRKRKKKTLVLNFKNNHVT